MCPYSGRPDNHSGHMLTHRLLLFETMRDPAAYNVYVSHLVRREGPCGSLRDGGLAEYVAKTPFLFFVKGRNTATVCLACDTKQPCWTTVPPSPMIGVRDFEKYVDKHRRAGCFSDIEATRANTRTTLEDIVAGTAARTRVLRAGAKPVEAPTANVLEVAPGPAAAPAARAAGGEIKNHVVLSPDLRTMINTLYGNDDLVENLARADTPEEHNEELLRCLEIVLQDAIRERAGRTM